MKRIEILLVLLVILISSGPAYSQNFEGILYGATTYTSKVDSLSAEDIFGQDFSLDETWIKDGYFKVNSSTDFMSIMLWRSVDTTLYWFTRSTGDTLWYDRTDSHPSHIEDYYFVQDADSVAGYNCDALVILRENGNILTYYYNPELTLEPEYYRNATNSAKYEILQLIKSPYLRLVIESDYGIIDTRTLKVEQKELPDELFDLPEYKLLKKMEY